MATALLSHQTNSDDFDSIHIGFVRAVQRIFKLLAFKVNGSTCPLRAILRFVIPCSVMRKNMLLLIPLTSACQSLDSCVKAHLKVHFRLLVFTCYGQKPLHPIIPALISIDRCTAEGPLSGSLFIICMT